MNNIAETRARYLADPLPKRLGALAADLARVSSSARHPTRAESVALMLEESQHFIEWAAAEAEPEVAAELVDIQVMVALWRSLWPEARHHQTQRALLSLQAKKWSEQVLDYSGLLNQA
ncbi:MAG: hypothetical protein ACT4QE_03770 [Anaerolineales bacterium]